MAGRTEQKELTWDMDARDYILEFDGIGKEFPGVKALDEISFGIVRGTIHCLIGENGAGKSTLLKIIDGLYKADRGQIRFDGRPWKPKGSADAHAGGIAMIHQELNIIPNMKVVENMYLGREIYKKNRITMDDRRMRAEAEQYLREQGLAYDIGKKMSELSIAEAQMIEIIKAISCKAKLILMDEPTSSLTEKEVDYLIGKIFALKEQGITVVFISHKLDEIFRIADYISVFRDGRHIATDAAANFTKASLIEKMVGREMTQVYPKREPKIGTVMLRVEDFNRAGVFEKISFEVRCGEILGISGLVGAGRTEIARSLIGLDPKDSGRVFLKGRELPIRGIKDSIKHRIAMVSENRRRYGLVLLRDVKENISMVALAHLFARKVIPLRKEKALVGKMIKRFAIKAPNASTVVETLSGGNQQKVVLAKWMAVNPEVLILDEPTRGIDVGTKYEIYKMMNEMTAQGMAIIMINSDMEELLGMSDRILVVSQGRITGELSRGEATPEKIMTLAVGG